MSIGGIIRTALTGFARSRRGTHYRRPVGAPMRRRSPKGRLISGLLGLARRKM
ncbi:hypothetical protein [Roseivivax sp. CAU 1761]